MNAETHTARPFVARTKVADNVGGWDYSVSAIDPRRDTSEPVIIAEFFEIVGGAKGGGFVKLDMMAALDAYGNLGDPNRDDVAAMLNYADAEKKARAAIAAAEGR